MPLNEYQRSSLQVSLKLLEKMLMEIEVLLNPETEGTLYRRILDIHTDRRSQILAISQDARREIAELATIFDLKREEMPVHQIIVANLSRVWADLEDTRPTTLARYGDVDPALKDTLDPRIDRLIKLVLAMEALAEQGPHDPEEHLNTYHRTPTGGQHDI